MDKTPISPKLDGNHKHNDFMWFLEEKQKIDSFQSDYRVGKFDVDNLMLLTSEAYMNLYEILVEKN